MKNHKKRKKCCQSYVYDTESGLYYLQSRYYDPELGRFINADALVSTGQGVLGNNMFAYCRNNPICRIDVPGTADQDCVGADEDVLDDEELTGQNGGLASSHSSVPQTTPTPAGYSTGKCTGNNGGGSTTLYRSVGANEAQSITETGKFVISPKGMEGKQFGFSKEEVARFGNFVGQSKIVSVKIPTNMLGLFDDTAVDTIIFRHGTLTVSKELLDLFNELIAGTIEFL